MIFEVTGNVGGGPALENLTVRSRWQRTGLGRADLRIAGGDAGAGATASECWDTQFKETFYTDSGGFKPTAGDVSACGTFSTANLPPQK